MGSFWLHFGSIWGPWRGPVAEKLRSRTEGRWGQLPLPDFKRFWAQKVATRGPKIHQKSMKISTPRGSRSCIHFRFCFGFPNPPSWDPTWSHLGSQFRFKTAQEASQTPPRGLPDPPWSHLGSQIPFKTAQEASGTPKRPPRPLRKSIFD